MPLRVSARQAGRYTLTHPRQSPACRERELPKGCRRQNEDKTKRSDQMPKAGAAYQELEVELKQTALLASCAAVLGWDEQVNLPPQGAEHRANQLSSLAGLVHERATAPRMGDLLQRAEDELGTNADSLPAANLRDARRNYDRATKLPRRLVEELSRVTTLSQQAWVSARQNADFGAFLPRLEQIVALKREQAQAIGFAQGIAYDALLDEFEPGATSARITELFDPLRADLVELVAAIADAEPRPDGSILTRKYPIDAQRDFGRLAAARIGFDFDAGRLDVTAHPFCSGFGPGDCRLTTRYDQHHFPGAFFGTLHESGHGIYEQGLRREAFGTALGESCSLGIHESQSRMWENFVGRALPFWKFFYTQAQQAFPEALGDVDLASFHAAINEVRPSFIRVEADEVTYNLHVMLRFELEKQLIAGDLAPADVPTAWNEMFKSDFGITPPRRFPGMLAGRALEHGTDLLFPDLLPGKHVRRPVLPRRRARLGRPGPTVLPGRIWQSEKLAQYKHSPPRQAVSGRTAGGSGDRRIPGIRPARPALEAKVRTIVCA